MTLADYKANHPRCAVCHRPLLVAERTIQHIARGTGRKDDERNVVVCCWMPCHWARDGVASNQCIKGPDGVTYHKITDGQLLWCKLMEDGSLDLGYLTDLRRSLINSVIEPPPEEYLTRRDRHGR